MGFCGVPATDFFAALACSCLSLMASLIWSSLFFCCSLSCSAAAFRLASMLSVKTLPRPVFFVAEDFGFAFISPSEVVTTFLGADFLSFRNSKSAFLSLGVISSDSDL